MMKSEFEKIIGRTVPAEDYRVIDYVYTWHPAINNVDGKQQIADLYKIGGMAVIKGMVPATRRAEDIELRINLLKAELENLERDLDSLRRGNWKVDIHAETQEE
ncbi:MAG: hypothetical protein J6W04_02680 [Bacteroidales bacterium]|nr:hypothetical protein [Bacteroidales bacterium]